MEKLIVKDHQIFKEQYEALKEKGLDFKNLSEKHLTKEEIDAIKFQDPLYYKPEEGGSFANFSSFAYWKDSEKKNVSEQVEETITILQSWEQLQENEVNLHADHILLGVNAGSFGIEGKEGESFRHFEMFQIRSNVKDGKLRGIPSPIKYKNALCNNGEAELYLQKLQGAYMTDFIKGFPTRFGGDIKKNLKEYVEDIHKTKEEFDEFYTRFCNLFGEILENELNLLKDQTKLNSEKQTLIIMGKNPLTCVINDFLKRSKLDEKYDIINIPHYSSPVKQSTIVESFKTVFKY